MQTYDVIIIGGGPGGYVAAIKAAQMGAKTALIEGHKIGGVCLNYGCIPTKTLLKSAHVYRDILNAQSYGIVISDVEKVQIDWKRLMTRKTAVVDKIVDGVIKLLKLNNVVIVEGYAEAIDAKTVKVGSALLHAKNIILATGSSVKMPNIEGLDKAYAKGIVIDSTGATELKSRPKTMTILGGGVIAVEFATLFNSLGTKVTLLQRSETLLKNLDQDVKYTIQRHLIEEGVDILTGVKFAKIDDHSVVFEHDGEKKSIEGEYILASLGRQPNLKGFEKLNLKTDRKGVWVDEHMQTSVAGVYAIGDMCGKYMLAHVASAEGLVAVESILNHKNSKPIDYKKIASCIYSFPEVGVIGYTEEEAKKAEFDVGTSLFPLTANGKAMAEGETSGFVKIIHDKKYGEVIGVHIVASHATDMISEAAITMELEGTVHDLAKTVHPHPTLSEIVMEAAHGAVDKPIHLYKK